MKTIKNKLAISRSFLILLFLVFFVGLQNPLLPAGGSPIEIETVGEAIEVPPYPLKELESLSKWENEKTNENRITLDFDALAKCLIVVTDGKIYRDGNLYSSTNGVTLYVMDASGDIYITDENAYGDKIFKHPSFLDGKAVAAAGEITIINGVLEIIDNNSGHYKPTEDNLDNVVNQLKLMGMRGNWTKE